MSSNRPRDTAAKVILSFAIALGLVALASMRDWWKRADIGQRLEWTELPTAVEDRDYFTGAGDDDFEQPNLKFPGEPDGLFRLSPAPLTLRDFRMRKIARDASDRFFIYRHEDPERNMAGDAPRVFVKVADDRYLAFGRAARGPLDAAEPAP